MRRRHDERGAVVIITAFSMLMVLAAVAMSVDIGQQVWRGRQMQAVADMVALDAVRALGDQRDPAQTRCQQALTIAQQSATRNNFPYSTSGYTFDVQLGTVDPITKAWVALVDCTPPNLPPNLASNPSTANGVMITAGRPVGFKFIPGTGGVVADAIASTGSKADLYMGTWAGRLTSADAPALDQILCSLGNAGTPCSAGVTAAGYNGLANATINMGDLFTQLNLGTVDQVANTQVSYQGLLTAMATVMNNKGDTASATVLNTLASDANTTQTVKLGDFIPTSEGYGSAASLNQNVLEFVSASAEVANQTHLLQVNTLAVSVPGVASITMKASVIEGPGFYYGAVGGSASSAQVRTEFDLQLTNGISVCLPLLGCATVPLTLKMYAAAAQGTGTLTAINCAQPNTNSTITVHGVTNAVTLSVGEVSASALTNSAVDPSVLPDKVTQATILGIPVTITASGQMTIPGADQSVTMNLGGHAPIGASGITTDSLANGLSINVSAGALPITSASVLAALTPVIQAADTTLFNAISTMPLGIQYAGADIWNTKIDPCNGRSLVG